MKAIRQGDIGGWYAIDEEVKLRWSCLGLVSYKGREVCAHLKVGIIGLYSNLEWSCIED